MRAIVLLSLLASPCLAQPLQIMSSYRSVSSFFGSSSGGSSSEFYESRDFGHWSARAFSASQNSTISGNGLQFQGAAAAGGGAGHIGYGSTHAEFVFRVAAQVRYDVYMYGIPPEGTRFLGRVGGPNLFTVDWWASTPVVFSGVLDPGEYELSIDKSIGAGPYSTSETFNVHFSVVPAPTTALTMALGGTIITRRRRH